MNDATILLPPIPLFIAHAPRRAQAGWRWLWRFDQRLVRLAAEPSEPMLAQIRLAWWRDQLAGEGKAGERRDPALIELDAMEESVRSIVAATATSLVDAMEAMAVSEEAIPMEGAEHRGQAMANALARMIDEDMAVSDAIGCYWGLAQLAPVANADEAWRARISLLAEKAGGLSAPRALSLMRMHARLLVRAGGNALGPGAGLRLLTHALSGL